ncbi:MHC class II transactivator isoform X2 [Myripristis murdjan]|nr:MHC class II transactivator isoform X2 [Myripristis murdjan]
MLQDIDLDLPPSPDYGDLPGPMLQGVDMDLPPSPDYGDLPGPMLQRVDLDLLHSPDYGNLPGAVLQEIGLDQPPSPDYGDLPDLDVEQCLQYLNTFTDQDLFDLARWNFEEEQDNSVTGDVEVPTVLASPDDVQQRQTDDTPIRRKRRRVARSEQRTDDSAPSQKRQKGAGQKKSRSTRAEPVTNKGGNTVADLHPAGKEAPSTPPPQIVQLPPSIQFITVHNSPGCHLVPTLRLSPHPLIRLPLPNTPTTPTYILVPAPSPPCKRQVPPLSPVGGAVAPAVMGSSPPGSLSDTASKALSPPLAPPLSPNTEASPCKESPRPQCQSPPVIDIPQSVKDYIQQAKAHMLQSQEMEADLSLTSHYVDVQLVERSILRCAKNTNKSLDKELAIVGDAERQKSSLGRSQIFEGPTEAKPKRTVLLLGNASMGKTTLIKKLCHDWSNDCLPQFDFVFLLDGKALSLNEPTFSLQTLLLELSSSAPYCLDPNSVFTQVLAAPKRVLIIFDGFEELRDYEVLLQTQEKDLATSLLKDSKKQIYTVRQLYSAILQRVVLPGCTLLISTRPRGNASQLLRRSDRLLEVCGFTSTDVETYVSQYFTDPALKASAMDRLKNSSYLLSLCWNPGLCRLVCLVIEQSKGSDDLPRTLTGLCRQVLWLKMECECRRAQTCDKAQETNGQEEPQTQMPGSTHAQRCHKNSQAKVRRRLRTRLRAHTAKVAELREEDEMDGEKNEESEVDRTQERELVSKLSSLAWEGVKGNSSLLPTGQTIPARLRGVGIRTGLFHSHRMRRVKGVTTGERDGGGIEGRDEEERGIVGKGESGEFTRNRERMDSKDDEFSGDHILSWANPFLQSFLAGVHLSLSRTVAERTFLPQVLPSPSGPRGRRRPQREELELTQRFAIGLLFPSRTQLQRHLGSDVLSKDTVLAKRVSVTQHLEGHCNADLSPAQILDVCHYVHEASATCGNGSRDSGGMRLAGHLARKLPEVLTFRGVPLGPPDAFVVRKVLEQAGAEGKRFCLGLEDTGIQIAGLRAMMELSNINTYRACIADVINLWEELGQSGEEGLLEGAVSKFKINPLKATQVCHIEHLAKLVSIHMQRRLSHSSSQSDSILAEGVPAVRELHKLELELGLENGPLALPKLWELLPGLHNLQHLDLEKNKIGDRGAEQLAEALVSLPSLEVLSLSQNCIGDHGVQRLAPALKTLPSLHRLSLYSNAISDGGAESLAAVLSHMTSLTDLDVKFNKLTDVGAQSLGASLKNCPWMKSLRMWNECIPYGVFERLQQQDHRILSQ